MVLGLRRGKDGRRCSGPCLRAAPLRHRGRCGFTVSGAEHCQEPEKPPYRPNRSPIRLGHGNTGRAKRRQQLLNPEKAKKYRKLRKKINLPPRFLPAFHELFPPIVVLTS